MFFMFFTTKSHLSCLVENLATYVTVEPTVSAQSLERIHSKDMLPMAVSIHRSNSSCHRRSRGAKVAMAPQIFRKYSHFAL